MNDGENKNSIFETDYKLVNIESPLNKIFVLSKENTCLIPIFKNNCGIELKNMFYVIKENINSESLLLIINAI